MIGLIDTDTIYTEVNRCADFKIIGNQRKIYFRKMCENACKFNKFGYCKFGNMCRKVHHLETCENYYCENVKTCHKRHPRKCYYYCASGYCKFGVDCGFKHGNDIDRKTQVHDDLKIKGENLKLKTDLTELNDKHEKTLLDLDHLMNYQSKQDILKNDDKKKELEVVQYKFKKTLEKNFEMINQLNTKIEILTNENVELKRRRVYACDECDFDSYSRNDIESHKNQEHQFEDNESESDEDESPIYKCDLCEYNSGWPDNVTFHYREDHKIYMNWEEAELRLKE